MNRTYTEEEVQDLTDRVFLAQEQLAAGKVHFAEHLVDDFWRSLEAIRLRPDGKVDPSTVDSRIRAFTMAMVVMKQREDAKQEVSLGRIQESYFNCLFQQFGQIYDSMIESGASPGQVARAYARDEKAVQQALSGLPDLAEQLSEFWSAVGDPAAYHLQDGTQLKATFGGDLFPSYQENAVSTAGLYVDTIVLPCPIMRIRSLVGLLPDRQVVTMLFKHVLTAMSYRDLAIADVNPPLVLIVPDPRDVEIDTRKTLLEHSAPLSCRHAGYLFGRDFESLDELKEFCGALQTVDAVMAELKGGDRLVFDTDWGRDPRAQLERALVDHPVPSSSAQRL